MDEQELLNAERLLRDLTRDLSMQWVLDEVDEAVLEGVPEERILRRRTPSRSAGQSDETQSASADYETISIREVSGSKRPRNDSLVISSRPMTVRERVECLLNAIERVAVGLPKVERATFRLLNSRHSNARDVQSSVIGVDFVQDEEIPLRESRRFTITGDRFDYRHGLLGDLFTALREELQR